MKQLFWIIPIFFVLSATAQNDSTSSFDPDKLEHKGDEMVLSGLIFQFDKAAFMPESYPILDSLAEFLAENPTLLVEISYHSDCRASQYCCSKLTQKRADAIYDYLLEKGISAD